MVGNDISPAPARRAVYSISAANSHSLTPYSHYFERPVKQSRSQLHRSPDEPQFVTFLHHARFFHQGRRIPQPRAGRSGNKVTADGVFSLEEVECIGACSWAPAVQVNYDYLDELKPELVPGILDGYRGKAAEKKSNA